MIKYIADFSFPNFLEQVNMQIYCPNYNKMAPIILSSPPPPQIFKCALNHQFPILLFLLLVHFFYNFTFPKAGARRNFFGQMERDLK